MVIFAFLVTTTADAQGPTAHVTVSTNTVITMTYTTAPNTDLTKSDFKINGGYPLPANATLTKNADGTVWTLTLPGITDLDDVNPFRHKGYLQTTLNAGTNEPFEGHNNAPHLPAGGYAIIATYRAEGVRVPGDGHPPRDPEYPILPSFLNDPIIKRDWDDHFDISNKEGTIIEKNTPGDIMPDLWRHFQGGKRGTIDLIVINNSDDDLTDGLLKLTAPFDVSNKANRRGPPDSRLVIISEVMWARDTSKFGTTEYTQEQWIEIYNNTDDFILFENIRLTLSNELGGIEDEDNTPTDRLSNAVDVLNHWDITGKGQDGSTGTPPKEFVSMYRTKSEGTAGAGWQDNAWQLSSHAHVYSTLYRGSPGRAHEGTDTAPQSRTLPSKDAPRKNRIIINEIANLSEENDWIELRNNSGTPQSLTGWTLSIMKSINAEQEIIRFPDMSIPAGKVLLLVNKDPINTSLAGGYNVKIKDRLNQIRGADTNISYLIVKKETNHGFEGKPIKIPDNNDWLLILRSGQPWLPNNANRNLYNSGHNIEDVAGPGAFELKTLRWNVSEYEKKADGSDGSLGATKGDAWETTIFPLNGRNETGNKLLNHNRNLDEGTVHVRNANKHGFEVESFNKAPFTGIGYDRNVPNTPTYAGTPGYPNDVATARLSNLDGGKLVISELMLTTRGRYPQWIELHNTSKTHGIRLSDPDDTGSLKPWKIIVENHNSGSWKDNKRELNIEFDLSDWFEYIPPNQTVLITSFRTQRSNPDHFPNTRVADVFNTKKKAFSMQNRRDLILNAEGGFYIKIVDSSGATSDEIGNLDGQLPNARKGIGLDDPVGFQWPTDLTENGYRTSLIRMKDASGDYRTAVPTRNREGVATDSRGAVIPLGKNAKWGDYIDHAWTHAANTKQSFVQDTWYGDENDIGTPLHTSGTPLPVTLSLFRPVSENGKVVIHWTTESELDNAGFNILRSPTRNGTFKQINPTLIEGAGTSAERHTYKWIDTTAKTGTIYYYQIEDISLAGEKQTLATTKLKGLVSAKNKLTTQWGTLKEQD